MSTYVGAIVHYVSRGSKDGAFSAKCIAAMVTEILTECPEQDLGACVKLMAVNPEGVFFNQHCCFYPAWRPGTWHPIGPACNQAEL